MMEISYLTVDGRTAVILHIGDYLVDILYMPWRSKVHTLITIFLGTTIPSQFGLINLQISCQIVSKMIGVIRFGEGCYYVVPLSFKEIKNFAFLTYPFLINFYYKLW